MQGLYLASAPPLSRQCFMAFARRCPDSRAARSLVPCDTLPSPQCVLMLLSRLLPRRYSGHTLPSPLLYSHALASFMRRRYGAVAPAYSHARAPPLLHRYPAPCHAPNQQCLAVFSWPCSVATPSLRRLLVADTPRLPHGILMSLPRPCPARTPPILRPHVAAEPPMPHRILMPLLRP